MPLPALMTEPSNPANPVTDWRCASMGGCALADIQSTSKIPALNHIDSYFRSLAFCDAKDTGVPQMVAGLGHNAY